MHKIEETAALRGDVIDLLRRKMPQLIVHLLELDKVSHGTQLGSNVAVEESVKFVHCDLAG